MTDWLMFPVVSAPSSRDKDQTDNYGISNSFVTKNANNSRCTPIFQLWTHILGKLPPINNVSRLSDEKISPSLTTLHNSIACFSGLQRPHDNEDNGASVLIYVLNPEVSIKFEASMVCQASAIKVPKNTVLTVQVRPDYTGHGDPTGVNGIITRIEFVSSIDEEPTLPRGFGERYKETLWIK